MNPPPQTSFTLTVEAGPGTARLRLAGDLDYDTSEELVRCAEECLDADARLTDLHLDCAGLEFCDSMGIAILLMIHRKTRAGAVRLHLDNPPPFLERVLHITGIRHLFAEHHSPRQAERTHPGASTAPAGPRHQGRP
ncbi:STAS domain-containing protein [Streptomyces sp. NPDC059382]|uniref:STAS domain-containing protein n=1 Tax=unclassified Streptomyces TaxID=2593676 RepID=UPI0033265E75